MSREERLMRIGFGVLAEAAPPAPEFDEIGDQPMEIVRAGESRQPSALTPILAAIAVLVAFGVPALLFDGDSSSHAGDTPVQPPTQEDSFRPNMQEWTLIAVYRLQGEPDIGVYRGPLPDANGEVRWMEGPGSLSWPSGALSDRPYALVRNGRGRILTMNVADPENLIADSLSPGGTLLDRVEVVDQAAWEEFTAGRSALYETITEP